MKHTAHLPDEDLLEPTQADEEHLRACALCRDRREAQERVRAAMKTLDREAPASPTAVAMLEHAAARAPASRRRWIALAAAAAVVLASALVLLLGRRTTSALPAPLRDELVLDHLHYAPIARPAQVASSDPKVVSAALEEKLGRPVVVPSWEATTLLGGRSCHIQSEWVPLVLYERAGRRISLFAIPDVKVAAAACERAERGVSICAAPRREGGAYVAVADLPPHEIARLLGQITGS